MEIKSTSFLNEIIKYGSIIVSAIVLAYKVGVFTTRLQNDEIEIKYIKENMSKNNEFVKKDIQDARDQSKRRINNAEERIMLKQESNHKDLRIEILNLKLELLKNNK